MLSITIKDPETVHVDCDDDGLRSLEALGRAREHGHVHIKSPSTGGNVLSDRSPWGGETVAEVVITLGGD
jgi:hypothetical protein